jgi:hypothetical protein
MDLPPSELFSCNTSNLELVDKLEYARAWYIDDADKLRKKMFDTASQWKKDYDEIVMNCTAFRSMLAARCLDIVEKANDSGIVLRCNPVQEKYLYAIAGSVCTPTFTPASKVTPRMIMPGGPISAPRVIPKATARGKKGRTQGTPNRPKTRQVSAEHERVEDVTSAALTPAAAPGRAPALVTLEVDVDALAREDPPPAKRQRREATPDPGPDPAWLAAVEKQKAEKAAKAAAQAETRVNHEAATSFTAVNASDASKDKPNPTKPSGGLAAWGRSVLLGGAKLCT